jgi:hypothetical protein
VLEEVQESERMAGAPKPVPKCALFKYWDNRLNHSNDEQGNRNNDKAVPKKAAAKAVPTKAAAKAVLKKNAAKAVPECASFKYWNNRLNHSNHD